jgi:B12-binding domain/radical SAM domain protein
MERTNIYFIKDKFNKYSIKALLSAIETILPRVNAEVITANELKNIKKGLLFYSFNTLSAKYYAEIAGKKSSKDIVQVCGGSHPSARPNQMLDYFDAVCLGEAEYSVCQIIEQYLDNQSINGIYTQDKLTDLNSFKVYSEKNRVFGPIEITRGCKFSCSYCQVPSLYGNNLRHRSLDSVFENVELLMKNNKYDIRFITPDATSYMYQNGVNTNAIQNLLVGIKNILKEKGRIFFGSFPSEINPYFVNEDIIRLIKEYCSNKTIVIGLQTASKKMLKHIKRPTNIEKVENTIELFIKHGFSLDVDFILGMPGENDETIKENIKWINKWKKYIRIHAHYFMPLPSSNWENETPMDIPEYYVKFIKSLEGNSKIYGQWQKQKKLYEEEIKCLI